MNRILLASCSKNTQSQYSVYFQKWVKFCNRNAVNVYSSNIACVLEFLKSLFDEGLGYSSINSARSALSLLLPNIDHCMVGSHPLVVRFLKGVFKLRPSAPRYNLTWDVSSVLQMFKNWPLNEDLDLLRLSIKTVALLALVTAGRAQTLAAVAVDNIKLEGDKIVIRIPAMLKTSRPGALQPVFALPPYHDVKLCVVNCISTYLRVTLPYRKDTALFISIQAPHKAVSVQTISRWLKQCLELAGIDTAVYKGHSFRHASTSKAKNVGVSIDEIFLTGGWTANSNVFKRFYNRPVVNTFQASVLS